MFLETLEDPENAAQGDNGFGRGCTINVLTILACVHLQNRITKD
jgi:hypothetical protein